MVLLGIPYGRRSGAFASLCVIFSSISDGNARQSTPQFNQAEIAPISVPLYHAHNSQIGHFEMTLPVFQEHQVMIHCQANQPFSESNSNFHRHKKTKVKIMEFRKCF